MPLKYKCERDDFAVIIFNFSNIGKLLIFIMTIKGNQSIKNKIICLTIRLLLILCSYSALVSCNKIFNFKRFPKLVYNTMYEWWQDF